MQKQRIYLLTGEDEFRKRLYLEGLKKELLDGKADVLNYERYEGKSVSAEEIIDSLDTLPIDARIRLVVLNEPQLMPDDEKKRLSQCLRRSAKGRTVLVIFSKEAPFKDEILRPALSGLAAIVDFPRPKPDETTAWIAKEFRARRKDITRSAAWQICDIAGGDLGRAASVIEQVSLFTGPRGKITDDDVALFSADSSDTPVFKLLDAINDKDIKRSLTILARILHSGKNPIQILGLLNWHISRLLSVKRMLINRVSREAMASSLNIGSYNLNNIISQADKFSLKQLRGHMEALLDTDILMKRSGIKGEYLLEMLIVRLASS